MQSPLLSTSALPLSLTKTTKTTITITAPLHIFTNYIGIGINGISRMNSVSVAFVYFIFAIIITLGNTQEFITTNAPIPAFDAANSPAVTATGTVATNFNIPTLLNIGSLMAFPKAEQSTIASVNVRASQSTSTSPNPNSGGNINNNHNNHDNQGNMETLKFNTIVPCSLSDPKQNECIRELFNNILPQLKDGLPEYSMTSIDPYFYRRGIFRYANDGLQGGLLVRNMQIHGISNIQVKSFLGNFTDTGLLVKLGLQVNEIKADGEFKADVKFGGLRLVPKGPFNITLNNIRCIMLTDGEFLIKDNGLRVQLHRLNANVAVGDAKIIANGIFSDRNLNNMILNLVNENLMEIIRVGVPATREQWAPILVEHINNYFSHIPVEKFLVQ